MKLTITAKYVLAFPALNMIAGEIHEQVHINTGYWICGGYGPRDFNVWQTCVNCNSKWAFLATLAGPLFSCTLMWMGAVWFVKSKNRMKKGMGISVLFANLPFARIFTALTGGGDEKIVIQYLLGSTHFLTKLIAAIVVLLVCVPPVIMVYKKLDRTHRWWIVSGFLVLPLIFGMLYQRMLWNRLLQNGYGASVHIFGTPDIIVFHFVLMFIILSVFRKSIATLVKQPFSE